MANSPHNLFDAHLDEFNQLYDSVREKLKGDGKDERGVEQRKVQFRRAQTEVDEAAELISQMEIELQGIPPTMKQHYQREMKATRAELAELNNLLKSMQSQFSRADLFSPGRVGTFPSDEPYGPTSDRTRLLAGTSTLEDGTRRLQESHRIALETADQGAEILSDLRMQREQIENARSTLQTADSAIDRSSRTLKTMIRRMNQQRVVTAAIIILLVFLIAFIIYSKLF